MSVVTKENNPELYNALFPEDEIKEILDILKKCKDYDDEVYLIKQHGAKLLLDYITNLQDRTKELETINEEHRKINGELRKTINEAIDYTTSYDSINELMRYETSKDNKGLDRKTMIEMDRRYTIIHHKLLNILQNGDE